MEVNGLHNHIHPYAEAEAGGYRLGVDGVKVYIALCDGAPQGGGKARRHLLVGPRAVEHEGTSVAQTVHEAEAVYICVLVATHIVGILNGIFGMNWFRSDTEL